jgi:hypothetical protein
MPAPRERSIKSHATIARLFGCSTPPKNAYISRIGINNFVTRSLILQRFFLHYAPFFSGMGSLSLHSYPSGDMSKVIMNSFPKKKKHPTEKEPLQYK